MPNFPSIYIELQEIWKRLKSNDDSLISINDDISDINTTLQCFDRIQRGAYSTITIGCNLEQGLPLEASGLRSHAQGYATKATSDYTHAEGIYTIAENFVAHSEGSGTLASGIGSHAEGFRTTASGDYSHAEGGSCTAVGGASHAEGVSTQAFQNSHSEGQYTVASGDSSHAEGSFTKAEGESSHAEGYQTTASANYSHAEGRSTITTGNGSHAEGWYTHAASAGAHTEGYQTTSSAEYQHVQGKWNAANSSALMIVGNGTGDGSNRSNILEVNMDSAKVLGKLYVQDGVYFSNGQTMGIPNYNNDPLNDYEQGTWEPNLSGYSSGGVTNYSFRNGSYTKIGNIVHLCGYIVATAISSPSPSGDAIISNLPFVCKNTGATRFWAGVVSRYAFLGGGTNIPYFVEIEDSSNFLRIKTPFATNVSATNIANNSYIAFSITYQTD